MFLEEKGWCLASIVLPENIVPTAYIDSITPNPSVSGETISFVGHGTDPDGHITEYKWRSSIDGVIGTDATLSLSTLSNGTHTIYFSVKDDSGTWSEEAIATLTVNQPLSEDPIYQSVKDLEDKIDALSRNNCSSIYK